MPQRGFILEQNPLNIVMFRQFLRDLTAGIFAPLLLVTIKSLQGTLLYKKYYTTHRFKYTHSIHNGSSSEKKASKILKKNLNLSKRGGKWKYSRNLHIFSTYMGTGGRPPLKSPKKATLPPKKPPIAIKNSKGPPPGLLGSPTYVFLPSQGGRFVAIHNCKETKYRQRP